MNKIFVVLFAFFFPLSAYSQSVLQEADACFNRGDYACAAIKYKKAMNLTSGKVKQRADIFLMKSKNCSEWLTTANKAFNSRNYTSAKAEYQKVADSNPKDKYAKAQIERCNTELNRPLLRKATTAELTDIRNNKYGILPEWRQELLAAGIDPDDAQKRINAGEGKPTSQPEVTTKPTTTPPSGPIKRATETRPITLSVTEESLYFSPKGSVSKQIQIYSNASRYFIDADPNWFDVQENSDYIVVTCDPNKSDRYRQGYFTVIAGNKFKRIYVTQGGENKCFNCPKNSEKWGITVGYIQRLLDDDTMDGFRVGLRFEPLFRYGFGLNIGLNYEFYSKTFTDYSSDDSYGYSDCEYTYQEHVLNVPLHLEYHFNFSKYFNLFAYGGAALDVATDFNSSDYVFRTSLEYGCGLRIDHVQFTLGRSYLIGEDYNYVEQIGDVKYNKYKNMAITMAYMF